MIHIRRPLRLIRLVLHLFKGIFILILKGHHVKEGVPNTQFSRHFQNWFADICNILGLVIDIRGELPEGDSSVLYVSNHVSWLDIPVLASLSGCNFVSKAEITRWPVVGWLARHSGTIFISRGSNGASTGAINDICNHLNSRQSVMLFPEATTSDGSSLKHFHARLFAGAIETNRPIQPVALAYVDNVGSLDLNMAFAGNQTLLHSFWYVLGLPSSRVIVHLTKQIPSNATSRRKQLAEQAGNQITDQLSQYWQL